MTTLAALSLLVWLYLLLAHGRFWQSGPELAAGASRRGAAGRRGGAGARRGAADRRRRCARCWRRTMPGRCGSSWWTTAAATAPARSRASLGDAPADRARRTTASGRLERQAVGGAAGDRRRPRRRAGAADRRRHRARPAPRRDAGGAGGARRSRPGVRDGDAGLRHAGRARAGAGLRVLLPVALSVRLGERPAARDGGRGRRHHPGPPPRAAAYRRHGRRCAAR